MHRPLRRGGSGCRPVRLGLKSSWVPLRRDWEYRRPDHRPRRDYAAAVAADRPQRRNRRRSLHRRYCRNGPRRFRPPRCRYGRQFHYCRCRRCCRWNRRCHCGRHRGSRRFGSGSRSALDRRAFRRPPGVHHPPGVHRPAIDRAAAPVRATPQEVGRSRRPDRPRRWPHAGSGGRCSSRYPVARSRIPRSRS
jgi:hypothetical protein